MTPSVQAAERTTHFSDAELARFLRSMASENQTAKRAAILMEAARRLAKTQR